MFNLASDDLAVKPYIPHKVYYNEFVVNALRDNIGSKKSVSILRKIMEAILDSNIKNLGSGQTIQSHTINAIKHNCTK